MVDCVATSYWGGGDDFKQIYLCMVARHKKICKSPQTSLKPTIDYQTVDTPEIILYRMSSMGVYNSIGEWFKGNTYSFPTWHKMFLISPYCDPIFDTVIVIA